MASYSERDIADDLEHLVRPALIKMMLTVPYDFLHKTPHNCALPTQKQHQGTAAAAGRPPCSTRCCLCVAKLCFTAITLCFMQYSSNNSFVSVYCMLSGNTTLWHNDTTLRHNEHRNTNY